MITKTAFGQPLSEKGGLLPAEAQVAASVPFGAADRFVRFAGHPATEPPQVNEGVYNGVLEHLNALASPEESEPVKGWAYITKALSALKGLVYSPVQETEAERLNSALREAWASPDVSIRAAVMGFLLERALEPTETLRRTALLSSLGGGPSAAAEGANLELLPGLDDEQRALLAEGLGTPGSRWGVAYVVPTVYYSGNGRFQDISEAQPLLRAIAQERTRRLAGLFAENPESLLNVMGHSSDHYDLLRELLQTRTPGGQPAFETFPSEHARRHSSPDNLRLVTDWDQVREEQGLPYGLEEVRPALETILGNHSSHWLNPVPDLTEALRNIRHPEVRDALLNGLRTSTDPIRRSAAAAYLMEAFVFWSQSGHPASLAYPEFNDERRGQLVTLLHSFGEPEELRNAASYMRTVLERREEYGELPPAQKMEYVYTPLVRLLADAEAPQSGSPGRRRLLPLLRLSCPPADRPLLRQVLEGQQIPVARAGFPSDPA